MAIRSLPTCPAKCVNQSTWWRLITRFAAVLFLWHSQLPWSMAETPAPATLRPILTVGAEDGVGAEDATPRPLATEPDSLWFLSTRHMTTNVCRANLERPDFNVLRLDSCGRRSPASIEDFLAGDPTDIPVIYIHGNRREREESVHRGLLIYRNVAAFSNEQTPKIRWLIWSWPSEQQGILLRDVRIKANRTDSQGLYVAWLLRELANRGQRPRMIGFSFGSRIITGSLHALAGGKLAGRQLPGAHLQGTNMVAGLLAPAIGDDWVCQNGYHGLATKNLAQLTVLYNRRDIILKRYPLLERGNEALGYQGPQGFATRFDGSPLPVRSRNCSQTVGRHHIEREYYSGPCNAGWNMHQMLTYEDL